MKFYKGDALRKARGKGEPEERPAVYIPSEALVEAVNLAWMLGRPLLLMGEPGCGKTRLAEAVAYELHGKNFRDFYFRWDIKSSTKARDGLYRYDALKHLRDYNFKEGAAAPAPKPLTPEEERTDFRERYISDGELGKAFRKTKEGNCSEEKPPILLIDEIDKADIDFPNDLLSELETRKFEVKEGIYEETVEAKFAPFIVVTSNREKELPMAFLRRCVFFYIDFPEGQLPDIIGENFTKAPEELSKAGIGMFLELRKRMSALFSASEKNVSTSELIDWFKALLESESVGADLKARIEKARDDLSKNQKGDIPYFQVLLKNWDAVFNLLDKESHKVPGT